MSVVDNFKSDIVNELSRSQGFSFLNLIFIDLDAFVYHNDALGHDVGDKTLAKISKALQELSNIYNADIRRVGGDEFLGYSLSKNQYEHIELAEKTQNSIHDLKVPYVSDGYTDGDFEFSEFVSCSVVAISIALQNEELNFGKKVDLIENLMGEIETIMHYEKMKGKGKITTQQF